MHDRYVKYLGAIGVDPNTSTLGPWLECDGEHECFKDNAQANGLVKGSYREPYVVPEVKINATRAAHLLGPVLCCTGGKSMGQIRTAHLDNQREFVEAKMVVENSNPGFHLTLVDVDGEQLLRCEHGGMRVFWIRRGEGEVFLPEGYRTREGDGLPLPEQYQPDPIPAAFAERLRLLKERLTSLSQGAMVPVRAVLKRWKNDTFVGNFAGDLWTLEHAARPWSSEPEAETAIESLFQMYREQGFSTKRTASFERLMVGDEIIACPGADVRVRGRFQCLTLENVKRTTSHESTVRRLRYLMDTAGGCNPDFDPFRRLPLTWFPNYPGESGDGLNWINSHVVNIPKETSPTHFHPAKAVGGGTPQQEMYLVLDPASYQLNTWGRKASLVLYPDLRDLRRYEEYPLEPGMFVYIPPGTGHRGLDAFVNVLTIPGFRPHNEYYIDREIHDATEGKSPYNENLLDAKNYKRIDDLL